MGKSERSGNGMSEAVREGLWKWLKSPELHEGNEGNSFTLTKPQTQPHSSLINTETITTLAKMSTDARLL